MLLAIVVLLLALGVAIIWREKRKHDLPHRVAEEFRRWERYVKDLPTKRWTKK